MVFDGFQELNATCNSELLDQAVISSIFLIVAICFSFSKAWNEDQNSGCNNNVPYKEKW